MRKMLPIFISLIIVVTVGTQVFIEKNKKIVIKPSVKIENNIGNFSKKASCARPPRFLLELKIPQPVIIDLSQKRFKGVAFQYGKNFEQVLHPKEWEKYEHFSTYALDEQGNAFLVPTPFVSIRATTFDLQKNLYKLDSITGKISIFRHFDDVYPSPNNPYGINAVVYDCEDKTLWVAAIDETDYTTQRGVIYHIDTKTGGLLQKIESVDTLTLAILMSDKGKYLLVGAARDSALYAYKIESGKLVNDAIKLLELTSATEHIRKIKVKGKNHLELQTIPFSYALIAQTAKKDRSQYDAKWNDLSKSWELKKQDE